MGVVIKIVPYIVADVNRDWGRIVTNVGTRSAKNLHSAINVETN